MAIGSLGRMTIPLYMTPIYNKWGLYGLGLLVEVAMFVTLILIVAVYRDLLPLEVAAERRKKKAAEVK